MQESGPTSGVGWIRWISGSTHRPCRVIALLTAVVLFSLADLYMTLTHLLHFGMLEANPVARKIMQLGSPATLILWKLVTVGIAVGILFWARRRWTAEWAAAFCCFVMIWLTGRWAVYNLQAPEMTPAMQAVAQTQQPGWVTMAPEN
jgi:uncharacterized membrane protein YhfC